MANKMFQNIIKAQTDALKSVTEQTQKQIETIASAAEKVLSPEADAPEQTPPEAAGSGMQIVKAPIYATPTAINRVDTQALAPRPPLLTHAQRMARRDDGEVRRSFAERNPEMTGGEAGEALRELNTSKVMLDVARSKLDQALQSSGVKRDLAPATSYAVGAAPTVTMPYGAGPQSRVLSPEPQEVKEARKGVKDAKRRLYDAQDTYAAVVGAKEWNDLPTDVGELNAMMAAERETIDQTDEKLDELRNQVGALSLRQYSDEEVSDLLDEIDAQTLLHDQAVQRLTLLSKRQHEQRNVQAFGRMESDMEAAKGYLEASAVTEDKEKLHRVLIALSEPSSIPAAEVPTIFGWKEELKEKYALTDQDFADYAAGDPVAIQMVGERIEAQIQQSAQSMGEDYDFYDMHHYTQMLDNQQKAAEQAEADRQFAKDYPGWASFGSVLATPFQVLDAFNIDWGKGKPGDPDYIPPDTSRMQVSNMVNTVRGTVSREIEINTDWDLFEQNVGAFVYNVGMSTADSALVISTLGPGAIYLMGANATVNGVKDIIDRGGTREQALWGGLAAGAAEIIFEYVSVDNLLKPKNITGWRSLIVESFKQGGIEASEEMCTEIANILSDAAIMGSNSRSAQAMRDYMDQGMSEDEARWKVFLDNISQVAWAGAGGAISGTTMGGVRSMVDYVSQQLGAYRNTAASLVETVNTLPKMTMVDFTDVNSPVWRNVDYGDVDAQSQITLETHQQMVQDGQVVQVTEDTLQKVSEYFPDVRGKKRAERNAILSPLKTALKTTLREFLGGLQGASYELEVNGHILEATLYNRGIREVVEKLTQAKSSMLYHSGEIFKAARYLYSTPDYGGDPNVYRWNYFYTPVQIGQAIMGVRIAVRDMVPSVDGKMDSQIYHWGIKKDAPLDGGGPEQSSNTTGVSSDAPGSVSLDGEGRGNSRIPPDVSSDTASVFSILQIIQQIKSETKAGLETPEGVPEKLLEQFRPLLEKQTVEAERTALAKLLGRPDAAQDPVLAQFLDDQLAAAKEYVRLQTLDLSPEVQEHYRSVLEQGKEAAQWIVDHVQQRVKAKSADLDLQKIKGRDTIINMIKSFAKEERNNGKGQKESREAFYARRTTGFGRGIEIFAEGETIAYGYTRCTEIENTVARKVLKELEVLGIRGDVMDGVLLINRDGITTQEEVEAAATIGRERVLVNISINGVPKNIAGHEAFHVWNATDVTDTFREVLQDNLLYTSSEFLAYHDWIATQYFGEEVDLSDTKQLQNFQEELYAYIGGDIHEGMHDDILRPMFRDFEAVKIAWARLVEGMREQQVSKEMLPLP